MNKMCKVKRSKVHGSGVFATKNIKKNTRIIEYVGEKITKKEGDKRSVYIFELNKKYDIDGSPKYNTARYLNHSCNPNCEVDVINNEIWISSIKSIKSGAELTYDYGYAFDLNDYKDHICKCGSKDCIGFIISSDQWGKYLQHLENIVKKKINN